jgi:Putative silver efflux pump
LKASRRPAVRWCSLRLWVSWLSSCCFIPSLRMQPKVESFCWICLWRWLVGYLHWW